MWESVILLCSHWMVTWQVRIWSCFYEVTGIERQILARAPQEPPGKVRPPRRSNIQDMNIWCFSLWLHKCAQSKVLNILSPVSWNFILRLSCLIIHMDLEFRIKDTIYTSNASMNASTDHNLEVYIFWWIDFIGNNKYVKKTLAKNRI